MGFTEAQIARALEKPGVAGIEEAACLLLMDTTPVPPHAVPDAAMSASDLRMLNLDAIGCLIEALSARGADATKAERRQLFELLCRIDSLYREVCVRERGRGG